MKEKIDIWADESRGFISAHTQMPVRQTPVLLVGREEVAAELLEMVDDFSRAFDQEESRWRQLFSPVEEFAIDKVVALASRRILGIYTQRYSQEHENRILLVEENIRAACPAEVPFDSFLRWVLLHEMYHAAQFSTDHLREYLRSLAHEIYAGEEKKRALRDVRAAMTWIEGSADFVMDLPGILPEEEIRQMRIAIEARREQISWSNIILKILGNKTGQYQRGRALVSAAYKTAGNRALASPIRDSKLLPSSQEIENADLWIGRLQEGFE